MKKEKLTTKEYLVPFILISSLFFLWGVANGMLDTLNKHFQDILQLSKAESGLIQFSVYIAYFTLALPAGYFIRKKGYKAGIILGLSLFATGALLIAGTAFLESFWMVLACLFVMGCGLATLETAANPYTTKLGPPASAERRINFSQSFNGLAWVVGPLIGFYIYKAQSHEAGEKLSSMILPYLIIGIVVIAVAFLFIKTPLPEIIDEGDATGSSGETGSLPGDSARPLIKRGHFVSGVAAQFAYVAAQTGVFSYMINFVTDPGQSPRFDTEQGPLFLAFGFALFMAGRMSGSWLMRSVQPARMLALYSLMCCLLLPVVSANQGWISLLSLFGVFFFMSIMFPTIFALGIKDLGLETKKASSIMVMAIVGGAVFPLLMGLIADNYGMPAGFLAPIPCFAFILWYGLKGHKLA